MLYPPEVRAAAAKLYEETLSVGKVAEALGISVHTVVRYVRAAGVHIGRHNDPRRFWRQVEKTDACWLWRGTASYKGYGKCRWDHKNQSTHRISWRMAFGAIPEGMHVLHKCDVRNCVRPDHLYLGTDEDNVRDRTARKRSVRGSKSGRAKLDEATVLLLRASYEAGTLRVAQTARDFGMGERTLWSILGGKTWQHLLPPGARR